MPKSRRSPGRRPLRDIKEFVQNGYEQAAWSVEKLAESGHADESPETVLDRVSTFVNLSDALIDVDCVIEAVPEKLSPKKNIYTDVSEHAPNDAVFASNTSTISITYLSEATDHPEQFCAMTPAMNPHPYQRMGRNDRFGRNINRSIRRTNRFLVGAMFGLEHLYISSIVAYAFTAAMR